MLVNDKCSKNFHKISKNIISVYIFRKKERVNNEKILILQTETENQI